MKWLREPLVHFLALGTALFLVHGLVAGGDDDRGRIVVTAGDVERLTSGWTRTWQRPPTSQELAGLIEDFVREEVLYREALAMGLDRDDTIIRRRLRQKLEFLGEDIASAVEPTEDELAAYLAENRGAFRIEPRLTFRQVYVNRDRRGEGAQGEAERLLTVLASAEPADAAQLGDSLLLSHGHRSVPASEVAKLFGRDFADALAELEAGRWAGPVVSGYGLHLVIVDERVEGRDPELAEVRERVATELMAVRRREANEIFYARLRERYEVEIEPVVQMAAAGDAQ